MLILILSNIDYKRIPLNRSNTLNIITLLITKVSYRRYAFISILVKDVLRNVITIANIDIFT